MVMRLIAKPVAGELPDYAIIYLKLLPNDELVLRHLKQSFLDI